MSMPAIGERWIKTRLEGDMGHLRTRLTSRLNIEDGFTGRTAEDDKVDALIAM
jgi:hypothetical protein